MRDRLHPFLASFPTKLLGGATALLSLYAAAKPESAGKWADWLMSPDTVRLIAVAVFMLSAIYWVLWWVTKPAPKSRMEVLAYVEDGEGGWRTYRIQVKNIGDVELQVVSSRLFKHGSMTSEFRLPSSAISRDENHAFVIRSYSVDEAESVRFVIGLSSGKWIFYHDWVFEISSKPIPSQGIAPSRRRVSAVLKKNDIEFTKVDDNQLREAFLKSSMFLSLRLRRDTRTPVPITRIGNEKRRLIIDWEKNAASLAIRYGDTIKIVEAKSADLTLTGHLIQFWWNDTKETMSITYDGVVGKEIYNGDFYTPSV